ncbi:junctional adhesion molecule-like isoform X1 [Hippoglossus hippoglossus]|uniref:junctional adhesion molecule-like isoform X1 n=2 Tax=Hippoglossus hippoglossus TaxID=8267 RepID=UPI00148CA598|nr:junctional adhesion molecule-like isoform X1 [Hippoglossus hippoglossus]
MAAFYPQCLLLSGLVMMVSDCRADSTSTVTAYLEEGATLPCVNANMTDPKSCYRVRWMKHSTDTGRMEVVLAWPHKSQLTLTLTQLAKRVKWKVDGEGQMSLLLTKVQKSDEGLYSCEMCQGWDCTLVKNTSLVVKDCKVLQAITARPSKPIKLNCRVDVTPRPQNISWFLVKGGEPQSLPSERVQINHTSLVILSVRASDSAWYRCNYTYNQTQRCFDIRVQVQDAVEVTPVPVTAAQTQQALTSTEPLPEKRQEESRGTIIAVVSSVVIGIVVAAAVIGVLIHCCRNTQKLPQQTQSSPAAGTLTQPDHIYERVTCSDDPSNLRVNSIYRQYENETPITFHY